MKSLNNLLIYRIWPLAHSLLYHKLFHPPAWIPHPTFWHLDSLTCTYSISFFLTPPHPPAPTPYPRSCHHYLKLVLRSKPLTDISCSLTTTFPISSLPVHCPVVNCFLSLRHQRNPAFLTDFCSHFIKIFTHSSFFIVVKYT